MQPSEQQADASVALVLADGRKVLKSGQVVTDVPQPAAQVSREIASGRAASRTLERMHRKLGELPDIPQKMNPVAAVIFYSAVGLNDADIAVALGASESQIATIKQSELYGQLWKLFDTTIFDDAKRNARHIIARASDRAAEIMVGHMESGDEAVSLAATREVARLAGISLEQSDVNKLSGLHIRITRKEDEADDITITTR